MQNDYKIPSDRHIESHLDHMKLDKLKVSDLELWQKKVLESVEGQR